MSDVEMETETKAAAEAAAAGPSSKGSKGSKGGKRFEIKKWNAVAMWSWAICTDTCAICRNNLYEPSIEYQANPTGGCGVVGRVGGRGWVVLCGDRRGAMPHLV
jgi:RING-box protein 1